MMIKPPALKPGGVVGVVAPASNLKSDYLAAGAAELARLGFRVKFGDDILAKDRYTAGSLERRLAELERMWTDPEVDAVMAARGGSGALHLLPRLDARTFRAAPKPFIGYSDVTALHAWFASACQLVTFHGPMAAKDFAGGPTHYDVDSFTRLVCTPQPAGELTSPGVETLVSGTATGRLAGGCLPLLTALIGTPWQLDLRGAVVFLEDTAAKPYQIDRMLFQMIRSGALEQARGVVFGEMSGCAQHVNQGYALTEVLRDLIAPLGVPALFGWRSGHSEIGNLTLPLGVAVTLDADARTLTVLESAVR